MKVKLLVVISLFVMFCGALRADTIEQFTFSSPTTGETWVFDLQQNPTLSMTGVSGSPYTGVEGIVIANVPAVYTLQTPSSTYIEDESLLLYFQSGIQPIESNSNTLLGDLISFLCNPLAACAWDVSTGGFAFFGDGPIDWSDGEGILINDGTFTATYPYPTMGGTALPTLTVVALSPVPEPTTALMLAIGLLVFLVLRRWLPMENSAFK